jgi:hypothetical protein
VVAHRRARNEGLGAQRQRIVLAHQSQHAFGVDDQAVPAQLLGDPPIRLASGRTQRREILRGMDAPKRLSRA